MAIECSIVREGKEEGGGGLNCAICCGSRKMSTGFAYGNWIMATDPLVVPLLCYVKGGVRGRCAQQVPAEARGGGGGWGAADDGVICHEMDANAIDKGQHRTIAK